MPVTMTKDDCLGCEDDFYNDHNPMGVKECWLFKTATLIMRRRVGLWEPPPWTAEPELLPHCYHAKGVIFVQPDRER